MVSGIYRKDLPSLGLLDCYLRAACREGFGVRVTQEGVRGRHSWLVHVGGVISTGQAARAGKGRTEQSQADLPPEVIEEQRDIEPQGEPLLSTQEHDAEEAVDGVFWQHQLKRKQRRRPE